MTLELKTRVLTGVIGAVAVLSLLLFAGWLGVFCLASVISLGMVYEFTEITFSLPDRIEKRYFLLILTWILSLLNLLIPQSEFAFLSFSFLILFFYFLGIAKRHPESELLNHFRELMSSLFALVYLVFIPFFFSKIYGCTHGTEWIILFLLIVWAGDSGAYFVGKRYGRHKLYLEVSPKKSVEGAIGGLASGFVITFLFKLIWLHAMSWLGVLFIPLIVGVFAQTGDLCESLFKRAFNKKDSGSILPGHGGFLDRFDGMVFSLPVMYACVRMLG